MIAFIKKIYLALASVALMTSVGIGACFANANSVTKVEAGDGMATFNVTINTNSNNTCYSNYNELFKATVTLAVYDGGWKMSSGWTINITKNDTDITAPVYLHRVEFTYTVKETGGSMAEDTFSSGTHNDNVWIGDTESLLYTHYGAKISISQILIFAKTPASVSMLKKMSGTPRAYVGGQWTFDDVDVTGDISYIYSQTVGFSVKNYVIFSSSTPVPDEPTDQVQVTVTATPMKGSASPLTTTLTGIVVEPPDVTSVTWNNPSDIDDFEGEQITSSLFDVDVAFEDESSIEGATVTQAVIGEDVVDLPYSLKLSDHNKTLKAIYGGVESTEGCLVSVTERFNDIYNDQEEQINAQNLTAQKAAISFINNFNDSLDGVCVFDGSTSSSSLSNSWSNLSSLFKLVINMMESANKQPFKDLFKYAIATTRDPITGLANTGDSLQNMLARYDYIYSVHGSELELEDFLSTAAYRATPISNASLSYNGIQNIDNNEALIVILIILLSISTLTIFVVKQKRNSL